MATNPKLQQEVVALGDLSRDQLAARWTRIYGCPPPSGVRREVLVRAAAWHLQAKRLGGLSTETKKRLAEAVRRCGINGAGTVRNPACEVSNSLGGAAENARAVAKPRRPQSKGTRLLRDWNGKTHIVDVMAEGFLFDGKLYRSLTAIAQEITGAHWSGPRFFGL
ncbi:DUF2924 domain-containing protein [Mesorhizobium newzealandense]|uniref:DUF2924 domain-containing protein n=1 Tax=Mesorhizobium newzealandense TaxID=1300302 RepID=A0ABW4UN04_9HYPH